MVSGVVQKISGGFRSVPGSISGMVQGFSGAFQELSRGFKSVPRVFQRISQAFLGDFRIVPRDFKALQDCFRGFRRRSDVPGDLRGVTQCTERF